MGYADLETDGDRRAHYNVPGIYHRIYREYYSRMEYMGLQQYAIEYTWSDMLAILRYMVFSFFNRDCIR